MRNFHKISDSVFLSLKDNIVLLFRAIFIDPATDQIYKYGQLYKRPKLAHTLRIIAKEGGDALNGGSLTKALAKDIQDKGGIVTVKDLVNYK